MSFVLAAHLLLFFLLLFHHFLFFTFFSFIFFVGTFEGTRYVPSFALFNGSSIHAPFSATATTASATFSFSVSVCFIINRVLCLSFWSNFCQIISNLWCCSLSLLHLHLEARLRGAGQQSRSRQLPPTNSQALTAPGRRRGVGWGRRRRRSSLAACA